jgi:hypothetical protein
VSDLTEKNFGLVIAYILPGFVALWGASDFVPTADAWINSSERGAPTVAGFMYVTLASLAAGLTVSAVRWAVVDHLHHATGLVAPAWRFTHLDDKLEGFITLVEHHYRYYQFYASTFIAGAFSFSARMLRETEPNPRWASPGCREARRPPGQPRSGADCPGLPKEAGLVQREWAE